MPAPWTLRASPVPSPRPFPGLPLSGLRRLLYAALVLLLRGVAKGESTARLARELGLSRKQLHTLRQRIQTHVNATAPTHQMMGTAFESDELYQNAGGKKYAASRPS